MIVLGGKEDLMKDYGLFLLVVLYLYVFSWVDTDCPRNHILIHITKRLANVLFFMRRVNKMTVCSIIYGVFAHISLIVFFILAACHNIVKDYMREITNIWILLSAILAGIAMMVESHIRKKRATTKKLRRSETGAFVMEFFVTGSLILLLLFFIGCIGFSISRQPVRNVGNCGIEQTGFSLLYTIEREREFEEFEKFFREQQDDVKKLAEELMDQKILEGREYEITFNEEGYSGSGMQGERIWFLYSGGAFIKDAGNAVVSKEAKEMIDILNENTALKETLDSIIEKGVIRQIYGIYLEDDIWELIFFVDGKFTPFITENYGYGISNDFIYCGDERYDTYDGYYKKIEDNWYLWISPAPDD